MTLRPPTYALDADELRGAVTPRTRVLLLNTPHNPTGTVLSREELTAVAEVAVEHDLVVVVDEVYEHMAFDVGRPHVPIASLPGMRERTLSISSAGKTFSFTAGRSAGSPGPADLVEAVRLAKQFLTFVSRGAVPAGRRARPRPPGLATSAGSATGCGQARPALRRARVGRPGRPPRPQGTYFATTDVRPLGYDGRLGVLPRPADARRRRGDPARTLLGRRRPPGAPLVRWAFCKRDAVLLEAVERLRTAFA